ncbi:conjugal transfer protein TrbF [Parvularcula sp. IMCC14364]|uniref:conjugal transfer protein TrbF n=1 Tax=Parvularcula sp. IMCC14364 TaxID=3067902 RepID=UPI00274034EA|nr:conjugal transfer protein TrbF [Parvularcula sp. IMCC14364]
MKFKRPQNHYGESAVPETPYQKAGQVWDERLGSARVQARNWRLAAFGLLLLAGGLAIAVVWQGSRSIVTPYVVEVSEHGTARAIGPAMDAYSPTDAQIAWHLAEFIKLVRAVSIDPVVVRENWLQAYDYTTDRGAATLNEYARENDPFAEVGERSVSVEIISVVRSSGDTFDIRWQETSFRQGRIEKTERYTASLTTVLTPPRNVDTLRRNPLGIYVHGLDWSKDFEPGGAS